MTIKMNKCHKLWETQLCHYAKKGIFFLPELVELQENKIK